jgi:transposase InsO family protein
MDATLIVGAEIGNVAEWCRVNGVNVRTFYRHRARIRAEGQWQPRSRRPHNSPGATPEAVVALIVRLREDLAPDNGADNIRAELETLANSPGWPAGTKVPARATINRILDRNDLLDKNPKKRPRASWRRFSYARPRDCYQIDGTEHVLADGTAVVAIDVLDDCSRTWVASRVAAAETTTAALAAFDAAVRDWGAPGLALADNGTAWAHPQRSRDKTLTSEFSRTIGSRHGSRVVHSSPYHPQTCGKVERLHGTAKRLLAHRWPTPATTITELQARLDEIREHYNTHRRHSAIGTTPAQAFAHASSHGGPGDLPRQDDATIHKIKVMANGTIALNDYRISVGRDHAGTTVTLLRSGERVTAYTTNGDPLGHLILDNTKKYQGKIVQAA